MNGNISEDGLVKDLDWMSRVGLGGVQNFDAALATPQIIDQRLAYMTPEWRRAFRLAVEHAAVKGLEFGIAGSPGWSETGGPWVPPCDGMKKLVWTETLVDGGQAVQVNLPAPPSTKGTYQDAPYVGHVVASTPSRPIDDFYADHRVLAIRAERWFVHRPVAVSDLAGPVVDPAALFDGSYLTALPIQRGTTANPGYLEFVYDGPVVLRSARIAVDSNGRIYRRGDIAPEIQGSTDGRAWVSLAHCEMTNGVPTTVSFPAFEGSHFRVVFHPAEAENPRAAYSRAPGAIVPPVLPPSHADLPVREVSFMTEARVDYAEYKAGYAIAADYYELERPAPDFEPIGLEDVIDVTDLVSAEGTLCWDAPAGHWRMLRLGYSLTGTVNHPATAEATGLEVDKYDSAAVRRYIERYIANFREVLGDDLIGAYGLRSIIVDSIETGLANWTDRFEDHFRELRGYCPIKWLPALTGIILESRDATEKFLYDFRRTLADLLATQHYRTVAEVAHEHGLLIYGEATEVARPVLGDDIAMRRYTDVPMSAMWTFHHDAAPRPTLIADIKGAASVAHLYGQNLAAAESLTSAYSPWAFAPWDLKLAIDLEFAMGINRPVLHSSVHQPVDDKQPGLSLGIFGQYFNRHDTWAEMARPWIDYIARCSHMLRLGRFHANVAYFTGEEAPLTSLFEHEFAPHASTTCDFDFVNADALLDLMAVEDGAIVTPSGCRYRLLLLGGSSQRMTVATLKKVVELVEAGAVVVGSRPTGSPSLQDSAEEFAALADLLWTGARVHPVGMGRVYDGVHADAVLAEMGVVPDLADPEGKAIPDLMFIHRREKDGDIYFLSNRRNEARTISVAFGVSGRAAHAWDAASGIVTDLPCVTDGRTSVVHLSMPPRGSVFVSFSGAAPGEARGKSELQTVREWTLDDVWDVSFQEGRGAPARALLRTGSLTDHEDQGIRHFSGVAAYAMELSLPALAAGDALHLDLGEVGDLAEVHLNGVLVDTVWKAPWTTEIGRFAREGQNQLEVRVANVWVNRLIGDAGPGEEKITFTTVPTYHADAPLRPSGLIGPVRLRLERQQAAA